MQTISETQLLDTTYKRMVELQEQGRYQKSLELCLQIARTHPRIGSVWENAAINCLYLARWQEAMDYAQTALACGCKSVELYDVLAYAHSELGQWDEVRRYGLQALNMRMHRFDGEPAIPLLNLPPIPPPPSPQTRQHNIIAFSLFGGDSKYCEPAILNVLEQRRVYPHWICRFYVDASVPESVISRLQASGAQIAQVQGAALQWPGPMWRLLALDDPQAHRALFRDADSVISLREAHAVEQWLASGKRFHMMRDHGAHTELILAGLWGAISGSLPPLDKLMKRFMSAPLVSRSCADQNFLRQYVWPYARTSLMQHDSVFGFMDAVPFPDEKTSDDVSATVGYSEGAPCFTFKSDLPDGSEVTWGLYQIIKNPDSHQTRVKLVCSYRANVNGGIVKAHIPARYKRWIEQGIAQIGLIKKVAPQGKLDERLWHSLCAFS